MTGRAPEFEVLLTGGAGQIGTALRRLSPPGWSITAPTRAEFDITDAASVERMAKSRPWSAIVNAAAYTAVDRAETEVEAAWRTNALAPALLAKAAARLQAPFLHISTDYVFDGAKASPYVEDDSVGPINVYGASKEGGEQAVRTGGGRYVILRTAWVVSPDGSNFVKTMLRLGAAGGPLRVVDDQRGNPTSARDVAEVIVAVATRLAADPAASTGVYHCVNSGEASWYDVARAVFAAARPGETAPVSVEPITTAAYPTAARRPANSRLATDKLQRDYGIVPRPWRAAVTEVVETLQRQREQATE